jgi:hypothetical protein
VTDDQERRTFSQPGTARALVLLGSALAVTAAAGVCFVAIVFGPTLAGRPGLTGAAVLGSALMFACVVIGVVLANVLAIRARSLRRVVAAGCGTLLAGVVVGLAVLLVVIAATS